MLSGALLKRSYGLINKSHQSTMSSLSSVVDEFTRLAPLTLAESWDNVGLLVEPSQPKTINKILLTNDLTESVMDEAIASSIDLIYSYHPPIFASLKKITTSSWKVRTILLLLSTFYNLDFIIRSESLANAWRIALLFSHLIPL